MISLIVSALTLLILLAKEFFDWRKRVREAAEADQKQIEQERRIADSVVERMRADARHENSGASAVEDKVDAALRGRP